MFTNKSKLIWTVALVKITLAMLYNLRNGRTIEITIEEFLYLTDQEIQYLEGMDIGDHIEDPFHSSTLTGSGFQITEEIVELLTDIPASVKLSDKEFQLSD